MKFQAYNKMPKYMNNNCNKLIINTINNYNTMNKNLINYN